MLVDRWGDVAGSANYVVKTYPMSAVSLLDVGPCTNLFVRNTTGSIKYVRVGLAIKIRFAPV